MVPFFSNPKHLDVLYTMKTLLINIYCVFTHYRMKKNTEKLKKWWVKGGHKLKFLLEFIRAVVPNHISRVPPTLHI